jgi:HlyD family secretion protein
MHQRRKSQPSRIVRRLIVALGAVAMLGVLVFVWMRWHEPKSPAERYVITGVRRSNLFPTQVASGRVESAKRTVIDCELENVSVGVGRGGPRAFAAGASTLLSVVPEGTTVKKGDVLAVLDSSDYEELLRLQRITVERSKSDKLQADLNLEIAKLQLQEFTEGTLHETIEDFEGKIFLSRSDLERANERLTWTRHMKEKGYAPASQVATDEFRQAQMAQALAQQDSAYALFKKFTAPTTARVLGAAVEQAKTLLHYEELRFHRHLERLAMLEKQVENCTIRAPHDGFLIYANNGDRALVIEPGTPVRQKQHLFYLPDLNDMEVVAMLHQAIIDQVGPGMRARVQVEGVPDLEIEGHVASIAPMPTFNWRSDVQYFEGIVKIENKPQGLRPGMTAEVEIALPRRNNVLAVPSEAVRSEDGHDVCLVVHDDTLERREVKLGQVTRDLAEVTKGLEEGEQVVLNPTSEDASLDATSVASDPPAAPTSVSHPASSSGVVAALH